MRKIVLTGFMGTGKTAVGQEVARRLSRRFIDLDAQIEAQAGKSISRIFTEDGEGAFRRMEASLCAELSAELSSELSAQQKLVIATGGGALVDPAQRALMMKKSVVVCLACGTDEILRRVSSGDAKNRPLLNAGDPRLTIERLLSLRAEAYSAIPWQIDTTRLSIDEVAAQVIEIAAVITLPVRYPGGAYEVHINDGLLEQIGSGLRAIGVPEGGRVALVSNPVVAPLYAGAVNESLRLAGLQPFACLIPDGEQHKNLATVEALYERFLSGGLDRSGTVLSLGGGVTGDLAGFAAATFMRGVRFAQIPTTLLAMVDAGVGGKTGVDLPRGKNLVGAFHQPAVVMIDPAVLATLPTEEVRCGVAEMIKHGIIGDPDLFVELETIADYGLKIEDYKLQIARALRVKIDIVEGDPFEEGARALLNLGHTVGHALERLSGFKLRHGEAVSIGMVAEVRIAVELGRADRALAERIETVLASWGLPVRSPPFAAAAIWEAMAHDKKRRGGSLRFALPRAIGHVEITEDIPSVLVQSVLHSMGARGV